SAQVGFAGPDRVLIGSGAVSFSRVPLAHGASAQTTDPVENDSALKQGSKISLPAMQRKALGSVTATDSLQHEPARVTLSGTTTLPDEASNGLKNLMAVDDGNADLEEVEFEVTGCELAWG